MYIFVAATLLFLFLPHDALAWGAGTHLQLGTTVLNNLQLINPAIASIIGEYPYDFLYGCIAADITIGKKFTYYLQHCHRWRIGLNILENAGIPSQRACAYGYLAHLAADTVAHNYYVPYKTMSSFSSLTLKHAYWEMRFETLVDKEIWEVGRKVCVENYRSNDMLLRAVLSDTIFSFGTNKRIFNSILLVSRLEKWQQVLKTLSDSSRYALEPKDCEEYLSFAEDAVFDFLSNISDSRYFNADPTGERALATAEAVRKNLRLLYASGKISKADAQQQLEEMKKKLRESVCKPGLLLQILSTE